MKVTKMRGKMTYPMRATGLKSSSVDRIRSKGRERRLIEGRISWRTLIRGGISKRRLIENGLTDSVEVE